MNLKTRKIILSILVLIMVVTFISITSYAETSAETSMSPDDAQKKAQDDINEIADIIADVFQKIGVLVIFIGGIQIAWAMSSDNPEMKGQAIKLIGAGVLVIVMSTAYDTLINN